MKKILLIINIILVIILTACGNSNVPATTVSDSAAPAFVDTLDLQYATEFSVDMYEGGYACIHVTDGNSYVVVPNGQSKDVIIGKDATIIAKPCDNIYLAASSAMDLFNVLGVTDKIKSCSTKSSDYADAKIKEIIDSGVINYVGKYSAPDYEKLIELDTGLAIESTMIYHSPKIKEELESLDIPVFIERSSYEKNPLGRLEWIKLYGLLLGKEDEAEEIFNKQVERVNSVVDMLSSAMKDGTNEYDDKPKVVFFYISSNGYVNVRKPGDYVSKMIELAGGQYAFESLKIDEENALSTVNISWEDFYVYAKDADVLIYNGTIDGGIVYKEDLIKQNAMFADFKSVKKNRVYCSNNNMYQETSKMGDIIGELFMTIHPEIATHDDDSFEKLTYFRTVK